MSALLQGGHRGRREGHPVVEVVSALLQGGHRGRREGHPVVVVESDFGEVMGGEEGHSLDTIAVKN